jgi:DNA-binding PadR family transcriptional regulator
VVLEQFRRGAVRLHILHHAAEEEIHGAWITQELAHHGHHIGPGTLYPILHRLERDGLLVSREQLVEGRIRRLYTATAGGRRELRDCRAALRELAGEVLPGDDSS